MTGSRDVAATLARQFAGTGIAVGFANARGPESIEAAAKQLGAGVTAMTSQFAPTAEFMILAVPMCAHAAVCDLLSGCAQKVVVDTMENDDLPADELMGRMNAPR